MHLILFDLEFTGHHANYIRYITNHWGQTQTQHQLTLVLSPEFLLRHSELVDGIKENNFSNIIFQSILPKEAKSLNTSSRLSKAFRRIKEWRLLCKYAISLQADHCLVMYIDKLQLPIILGLKSPCPISGIYFRPSFHYKKISVEKQNQNQKSSSLFTWKDMRDYAFLQKVNLNPQVNCLFTLDPYVVKYIQENFKGFDCIYLPDPIEQIEIDRISAVNYRINIETGRVSFLIFGHLNKRKGISKVLDALELLPLEICQKICIILVGQLDSSLKDHLPNRIKHLTEMRHVQFICDFDFVSEEKISNYFRISDFILALYQKHIGMSGILLFSAMMQKPVLSQAFGLMGKLVHEYSLGMTVDSTQVSDIACAMKKIVSGQCQGLGNRDRMLEFAKRNSAEKFSQVIVEKLTSIKL